MALLVTDGVCDRHASWMGDLMEFVLREESRTRASLPGSVSVRYATIDDEPYEEFVRERMVARRGQLVVDRVSAFVAGSGLSAIVDLDLAACRARVRLQLGEVDPPATTGIESARLVHTSAQEIADALRARRTVG